MTSTARARGVLLVFALALVSSAGVLGAGCGGSGAAPTPRCIHDSDCSGQLLCVEGYCLAACATSKDCLGGKGRCVVTSNGTTCEPPEATTCHFNSQCIDPLVCSGDGQCRNQCETDKDCAMGQHCTSISKLCADPTLDPSYDPATNEFSFAADGGAADAHGTGAGDGAAGSAGGGGSGGGAPVNACADAGIGLAQFRPSNLPASLVAPAALADYTQADDATFDTDTLTFVAKNADAGADGGATSFPTTVVTMSNGAEAAVIFFQRYTLAAGKTLTLTGQRPCILAATDVLLVGGTIATAQSPTNAWSAGGPPGPNAAGRAGVCADDGANGGGAPGALDPTAAPLGGGGGGYCGPGGHGSAALPVDGGASDAAGPAGGQPYGTPDLVPLLGGSSGGSASGFSLASSGGGAVELVAGTSITIDLTGVVAVNGGGYPGNLAAIGAGSGGGLLVEAPSITVRGTIAANGGVGSVLSGGFGGPLPRCSVAGGDAQPSASYQTAGGGGGAGRIRFNTGCGGTLKINTGAIISPSVGTTCTTKGTLVPR